MSLEKRAADRSVLFDDRDSDDDGGDASDEMMMMMMTDLMKIVMRMVGLLLSDESGETSSLQVCVV